jgi:hypothetical protein
MVAADKPVWEGQMRRFSGASSPVADAMIDRRADILAAAEDVFATTGGLNDNSPSTIRPVSAMRSRQLPSYRPEEQRKSAPISQRPRSLTSALGMNVGSLRHLLARHLVKAVDKASPSRVLPF